MTGDLGAKPAARAAEVSVEADIGRGSLAHSAAALADQEHDELARRVVVYAGDKGVSALDPVHQTVLPQEFEGAIRGDRRRTGAAGREPLDDLVGAERPVAVEQGAQHLATDRRQALPPFHAQSLGHRHGIGGAALVIVIRRREYPLETRIGGSAFGHG